MKETSSGDEIVSKKVRMVGADEVKDPLEVLKIQYNNMSKLQRKLTYYIVKTILKFKDVFIF